MLKRYTNAFIDTYARTGKYVFALSLLFGFLGTLLLPAEQAAAITGSQFQAGRIIDDAVFYNKATMNAQQIQDFLDANMPVCDTWGAQTSAHSGYPTRADWGRANGNPPPYTCLKDFRQDIPAIISSGLDVCKGNISAGNKSAAQIIYDVSQACGINPQTMLVLMQKEQALVKDDWPWQAQYKSATGYGCPDSAPCDSEYYGFFNQVYQAARAFRRYAANPANYNYRAYRNNNILFHPNTSCGSSSIYIENQATANLYIYTPYQPNQAALYNLYGSGDGCSSYGNRNFWRMFNDWFGSTHGSLLRTASNDAVFYSDGSNKYTVPSMEIVAQYGLTMSDVRFVSQQELDSIPLAAPPLSPDLGIVVKSESDSDEDGGSLYLISNGKRIPIISMTQFAEYGFGGSDIHYLSMDALRRIPLSQNNLSNFVKDNDNSVYFIRNSKKHTIFELSKLAALNPGGSITTLSSFILSSFPAGEPLVDGDYIIKGPDAGLRYYNSTSYHIIPDMDIFECLGLKSIKLFTVPSYASIGGDQGQNPNCIVKNSAGEVYLMASSRRYMISSSENINPIILPDSLIDRAPVSPLKAVIKGASTAEISVIENNIKRPIPNMETYNKLGFDGNSIEIIPNGSYNSLNYGAKKLQIGALMLESSGGISIVSSPTKRLIITSVRQFNDFGFDWAKLIRVNTRDLAAYEANGVLQGTVKVGENLFLVDGRVRYSVAPSLDPTIGITNRSLLQTVEPELTSNTLPWQMTKFIKSNETTAVYFLENGRRRPIASWQKVVELGGENSITILSDARVKDFPVGSPI